MKTIYYLDIDNTLIDRDKYQLAIESNFNKIFPSPKSTFKDSKITPISFAKYSQIYEANRQGNQVDLEKVIQELNHLANIPSQELWNIYLDHDFSKFLLAGAKDLVERVLSQENNQIIYWTDGNKDIQFQKINQSGLWQEGSPRNEIKIFKNQKKDNFESEFSQIEPESRVVIIDDNQEVLLKAIEAANKFDLEITTIWMYSNKNVEGKFESRFSHTAQTPTHILELLDQSAINPEGGIYSSEKLTSMKENLL